MNEEKAREVFGRLVTEEDVVMGYLEGGFNPWIAYPCRKENQCYLHGNFNTETLSAILWWMENKS